MPTGIIATVDNGFATIDFVDQSLRGPGLAKLVEIGGAATIETITRDGPRRKYRVPVGNAEEAELIDGDEVGRVWSAGQDTGAATALDKADPNELTVTVVVTATSGLWKYNYGGQPTAAVAFNVSQADLLAAIVALSNVAPGEVTVTSPAAKTYVIHHTKRALVAVASDVGTPLAGGTVTVTGGTPDDNANWHTPVDQYTSANKYVGQVPNDTVLDRVQVHTGDASSYGGSGDAPLHSELVKTVTDLKYPPGGAGIMGFSVEDETGGEPETEEFRVGAFNAAFATHDGALGDDPGAVQASPDAAAGVNASLGDQDSALATDPGSTPDVGGSFVAEDYTSVQSTRQAYPTGEPTVDWKRPELDAYAITKGLNPSDYGNKAELFNAIENTKSEEK